MLTKVKVALSATIVLGSAYPAWAACYTTHPPFCSNICTGEARCAPLRNYRLGPHHVKSHAATKPQAAKSSQ
jgi:predicted  nucleic acid-binding Zn ribbon protein